MALGLGTPTGLNAKSVFGGPQAAPGAANPAPDNRTAYTGQFGQTTAAASTPGDPNNRQGQGAVVTATPGREAYINNPQLQPDYTGANPGQSTPVTAAQMQGGKTGGAFTNLEDYHFSELGGNWADPNSYANQQNAYLQMQAAQMAQRQSPQLNMTGVNMFNTGAGNSLNQGNATNFMALGNANATAGVANGQAAQGQLNTAAGLAGMANGGAVQGQLANAAALTDMAKGPNGPSMAELQLQQGAQQSMQQQMAMAAGARGGNASLALQNAGQNQGQAMGQLNQSQGLLRAQEELNNKQFAAQALQGGAGIYNAAGGQQIGAMSAANQGYGGAAGTQLGAYGTAGQQLGQISNNQLGQAGAQIDMGKTYAGLASQQGQLDLGQAQLNQQGQLQSQGMGYQLQQADRDALMQYMQQQQNFGLQNKAIDTDYAKALNLQKNDWTHQLIGAGLTALGTVGGAFIGGPAGAVAGGAAGNALGNSVSSDIRAKKNIKPAEGEVSDAFRSAARDADTMRSTAVPYPMATGAPAYSYEYKDPNQPGAAAGTHYGPMAQDLEKTPAGASVVGTDKSGNKSIDTARLSLLNTSELAKQRAELDALHARAPMAMSLGSTGQGAFAQYGAPTAVQPTPYNHAPITQAANAPMQVAGIDANGNPILKPKQVFNAGPSIGFGPGDMGYNLGA